MKPLDPRTLDTAFVPPGTPTFTDLIDRLARDGEEGRGSDLAQPSGAVPRRNPIETAAPAVAAADGLTPSRRRDLISALHRVAAALDHAPHLVPADPKWLQPRLARIEPAALGVSPKTWQNVVSNARAALEHCGIARRIHRRKADLTPEWQRLWGVVLAAKDPSIQVPLGRFVYFLSDHGIAPDAVGQGHVDLYLAALEASEVRRAPDDAYRAAVWGWNLAVRRLPEWPRQTLSVPSRQNLIRLPLDTFPASFVADYEAYFAGLLRPDPLAREGRVEALRPSSVAVYRQTLLRFASILVHDGMAQAEITDLEMLTRPEIVRRGLKYMLDRNDGATSKTVETSAHLLRSIGRDHVRRAGGETAELEDLLRRVALPPQKGLTAKNRERLRPLQDPQTLRRLLRLPEDLITAARRMGPTRSAALRAEHAVAIAILLRCPIRVGNLVTLHVERNLERPGSGQVFLVFARHEVKNRQAIEFELPLSVIALIDEHLRTWRPLLCAAPTPWLFPRRDGTAPMVRASLATNISRRIREETGLAFNPHLFRHLAAMLWLEANPGQYEVVRRLLGHTELSRTLDVYAGFEAGTATRLFGQLIDERAKA